MEAVRSVKLSLRTRLRERLCRLLASSTCIVGFLGVVGVIGVASASPASAHSAPNSPASNFVSAVTGVEPATATFTAKTIEATSRIELRWLSGPTLEVLDYDGYPYLRVGRDGVEQNQQSFAVYLNNDRNGATQVPENLKPEGPPAWKKISSQPVVRWHDHRAHWMGNVKPDGVSARPNGRQVVQPFSFVVKQGDRTYTVSGSLEWIPGPNPIPLLSLAVAIGLAVIALATWAGSRPDRRMKVRLAIAVGALALLAIDAAHLVGIAFGVRGSTSSAFGRMLSVGFVSIVAWLLLLTGSALVIRRRFDAYYLLVLGAGLVTVIGGFSDVGILSRSNAPFAFSVGLLQVLVALTLGVGLGLVVACVLLTRRNPTSSAGGDILVVESPDTDSLPTEPAENPRISG